MAVTRELRKPLLAALIETRETTEKNRLRALLVRRRAPSKTR
jgi:hypothetical protein